MKSYRTRSGPLAERPYYASSEIERICESELRSVGLWPTGPEPIRIERFIERRFGITVSYDDLPSTVLGWTKFGPGGVEAVVVARSLVEEAGRVSERRVNTTLAHEGGHGLLHAHLFRFGDQGYSLFPSGSDVEDCRILCREHEDEGKRRTAAYSGRWWEFQANLAMGALLLPAKLVTTCLEPVLVREGSFGLLRLNPSDHEPAARLLADTFDVNPIVARIRLAEIYPLGGDSQLTL